MKLKLVIIHSILLDGQLNLSYTIPCQSIIESYFNEFFDRLHPRCVILNTRPPVLQATQMLVYELTCKSKSVTALEGLLGSQSFAQLKKLAPKIWWVTDYKFRMELLVCICIWTIGPSSNSPNVKWTYRWYRTQTDECPASSCGIVFDPSPTCEHRKGSEREKYLRGVR